MNPRTGRMVKKTGAIGRALVVACSQGCASKASKAPKAPPKAKAPKKKKVKFNVKPAPAAEPKKLISKGRMRIIRAKVAGLGAGQAEKKRQLGRKLEKKAGLLPESEKKKKAREVTIEKAGKDLMDKILEGKVDAKTAGEAFLGKKIFKFEKGKSVAYYEDPKTGKLSKKPPAFQNITIGYMQSAAKMNGEFNPKTGELKMDWRSELQGIPEPKSGELRVKLKKQGNYYKGDGFTVGKLGNGAKDHTGHNLVPALKANGQFYYAHYSSIGAMDSYIKKFIRPL